MDTVIFDIDGTLTLNDLEFPQHLEQSLSGVNLQCKVPTGWPPMQCTLAAAKPQCFAFSCQAMPGALEVVKTYASKVQSHALAHMFFVPLPLY